MLELRDVLKNPRSATVDGSASQPSESPAVGRRMGRALQLLATVYAVVMLVVTLNVYTRNEQHPGLALFFVACTASFYIICYNALSFETALKRWLEQHYPALRQFSLAAAVVLATVPVGILYVLQPKAALKPNPAPSAKLQVATATLPTATTPPATIPTATTRVPATDVTNAGRISVLTDVRYWSSPSSTTVAIAVDENVQYEINRLAGPDRIYLDLRGSKLDGGLWGRKFPVNDSRLRAIRVAEHEGHVTRVTLETHHFSEYSVTPEPQSHRLLIELRSLPGQS